MSIPSRGRREVCAGPMKAFVLGLNSIFPSLFLFGFLAGWGFPWKPGVWVGVGVWVTFGVGIRCAFGVSALVYFFLLFLRVSLLLWEFWYTESFTVWSVFSGHACTVLVLGPGFWCLESFCRFSDGTDEQTRRTLVVTYVLDANSRIKT